MARTIASCLENVRFSHFKMENYRFLDLLLSLLARDVPREPFAFRPHFHAPRSFYRPLRVKFMSNQPVPGDDAFSSSVSSVSQQPLSNHQRLIHRLQPLSQSQLIQVVLHIADRFPGVDVNEAIQNMVAQEEDLAQVCP